MSSITGQLTKGAKWTGISTMIITVIQIIQFILLGNQMSISQFGLVGLLTIVMVFAQIILDSGFGSAIIQKEQVSNRMLSTLFWLNVVVGIVLFIVLFFTSGLIAHFFHRSELSELIRILAVVFLAAPIGQQSQYLLQKDLRFNQLGKIETISATVSFFILVILIFTINPIYAYVISQVVLYSLKSIWYFVSYAKTWRPGFAFDLKECSEILSFGAFQLSSRLVNRIGSNIDVILIGRFMGAEALGVYNLVYQIVTIPVLRINPIMTRVAFPLFSKNQHSHTALNDGFLHMTKFLSVITFPMLMGLASVSDLFILTFFGEKWSGAIPILQIMAIVGILRVLMNPSGSIILAKGKANIAFYWDAGMLLLYGVSLGIAVTSNSLQIVAWTYVLVSIVNFIMGRWLLAWLIGLRWSRYLNTVAMPFALSLLITAVAYVINKSCAHYFSEATIWPLIISVGVSAGLYLLLLSKVYPGFFSKLLKMRTGGRPL
ncbi:MOP flippase family protein [Bacillus sp. V59.32b]|uniref:teichuronic acid biosynthesis protein TuaB n=1 Tax=Bacillus sp. V59.32b TaxID=1758642 RepID=UPI000E3EB356|nr:MOP flippase family protein [Bacillus sp. V59.32b]RFU67436.1 colanic acid exporter [Bacillus sp. V59.32b]